MKVLHVPYGYFPDPVGGTEVYVSSLVRSLRRCGVESVVAAPGPGAIKYSYDGITVHRFAVDPELGKRDQYGPGDPVAAAGFAAILDREQPDVLHLHALSPAVSSLLVRQAKQAGIPVVCTYHTPTVTCLRGDLLRWGDTVCDGRLDLTRCTSCMLHKLGVPRTIAPLAAVLPSDPGKLALRLHHGRASTALGMRSLVRQRHQGVREFLREVDRVVVLAGWTRQVLLANDIPEHKIVMSRQGLDVVPPAGSKSRVSGPLRVAYLGRLAPEKGVDTLIQAVRRLAGKSIRLDLYGIVQPGEGERFRDRLLSLSGQDEHIAFHQPVLDAEVVPLLAGYDILAVPSRFLETGPLVALEAFAAGIPVIASGLGGLAEIVVDGVNGLLIPPGDAAAWAEALDRLIEDRVLLARLTSQVSPPRHVDEVAAEMMVMYDGLLT